MKKIIILLGLMLNVASADVVNGDLNDIKRQALYNEHFFSSADGEISIKFNQSKTNSAQLNYAGFISSITLCNALCKTYKFANNDLVVNSSPHLPYDVFIKHIDNDISITGFICKNGANSCSSYVTVEKTKNNKEDFFEVLYIDETNTKLNIAKTPS